MGLFRFAAWILTAAIFIGCAKGKSGPSASAPSIASNVAGQRITCPISGYYLFNGANYPCTPGQTVTVGAGIAPNPAPAPNPQIPANPAPNPVPTGVPPRDSCAAYSAQYPLVTYVVAYYQGQYVCMRDDIAIYYGLAVYQ